MKRKPRRSLAVLHKKGTLSKRLTFIAAFAVIGVVTLLLAKAVTPTASIQPENGTKTGNVQVVTNPSASGGSAVKFTAPTTPTGKPGPTNTGVPAGTVLTPKGSTTISTANFVADGWDVTGCIVVAAPNVTIRRSRIRCDGTYPITVRSGNAIVEDTELDGTSANHFSAAGIYEDNYVARRVNVHGSADGFKARHNITIEDSWVHDLYLYADPVDPSKDDHGDGIQCAFGGDSVTVKHNNIDIADYGLGHGAGPGSDMQIGTENGGSNSNWDIENNWFNGGGWMINGASGPSGTNNKIINNRFGTSQHGAINVGGAWTVTGNVWDSTGLPVN